MFGTSPHVIQFRLEMLQKRTSYRKVQRSARHPEEGMLVQSSQNPPCLEVL